MFRVPKIIHIVENLDRGAVENWLVRMFKHGLASGNSLDWTFYCILGKPGKLDEEVCSHGGKVIYSLVSLLERQEFFRALHVTLKQGNYDILHCHHDIMSAVYIAASWGTPIQKRLVHIHNADENLSTPSRLKQRALKKPMRRICLTADRVVGISNHTLDTFLAGRPRQPHKHVVHYYGVDPTPFRTTAPDRSKFRQDLNLAPDARILFFGGRIVPEKNPLFVIEVLAELRKLDPKAVAIFAGAGVLEPLVIPKAQQLNVDSSVRMLGWRADMPDVMRCCDWFILPRPEYPMEGFGLAVVEAQLAGLRMLLSKGIPDDPLLPTACFRRLSLEQPANQWAKAATELLREPAPSTQAVVESLKSSPIDMDYALKDLLSLYQ